MLTDEQRKAIEWCVLILRERKNPVADDFAETLRGMLFAASAAPAEGREAVGEPVGELVIGECTNGYSAPLLFKLFDGVQPHDGMKLYARAALATVPTMSEGAGEPVGELVIGECTNGYSAPWQFRLFDGVQPRDGMQLYTHPASEPLTDAARDVLAERETAWLIEWPTDGNCPARWWNPDVGWTTNANNAIRFSRKVDAEMFKDSRRFHFVDGVIATEHVFVERIDRAGAKGGSDD